MEKPPLNSKPCSSCPLRVLHSSSKIRSQSFVFQRRSRPTPNSHQAKAELLRRLVQVWSEQAYRTGKKLEWDYVNLRARNAPEADQFIQRPYRKGWDGILT
jgi:hypothetical protein